MDLAQHSDTRPTVRTALMSGVLVVAIDNPPVNALSHAVRSGLHDAVQAAQHNPEVSAILIVSGRDLFISGADIMEFGMPRVAPTLADVCESVESSRKPVIAAIHGAALGGGLELALAAHYRIALPNARLGFPEVMLGLLPCAGGTQRTPRLAGTQAALDLIISGRQINVQEAHKMQLVDRVADLQTTDAISAGLAYAKELIASQSPVRRTCELPIPDLGGSTQALAAARQQIADRGSNLIAPGKIIDAVEAATTLSFRDGLRAERISYAACQQSADHAGLTHAFLSERATRKVPQSATAKPRPVHTVGVIGGGTMGAGITVAVLDAGFSVTMVERDAQSLHRGLANVERTLHALVARSRMTAARKEQLSARLSGSLDFGALSTADLVIEAAFEDIQVKHDIFAHLNSVCKPGAILASNTSYLDLNAIAERTSRPQDVIGLHFFSPAHVMRLLEVVVPSKASDDVVATAFSFAAALRKLPVRAGVCDGFIGNRIFASYRLALDYLLEDGASPYVIDEALREFGFPMGPFQVMDLAGGDIAWATRKRRAATRDPHSRYVSIADRLCERGWFGQKTGRGWYLYPDGARKGTADPEVLALIDEERERIGIRVRKFSKDDIIRRFVAAIVNEASKVVAEGIALRPLDVDVTFVHGYGFPRQRGGPMHYADSIGVARILHDIEEFSKEDSFFWQPSELLEELVSKGQNFASLNCR